jgi:hypothetical protein
MYAKNENESISLDQFIDVLLELVNSKGWVFGGAIKQIDKQGNEA